MKLSEKLVKDKEINSLALMSLITKDLQATFKAKTGKPYDNQQLDLDTIQRVADRLVWIGMDLLRQVEKAR